MTRTYEKEISLERTRRDVVKTIGEINSCLRAATEDPDLTLSDLIEHMGTIEIAARMLREKLLEEV